MAEIDPVVLELIAKNDQYLASLSNAQRVSERRLGEIERVGTRMSSNMSRAFGAAGGALVAYLGTVVTLNAARELLRIADSAKSIEAQLRLATKESGNFAQAQRDVQRIATETRSGLEETAQLYATFQRNALELGITQEQAARATETVTKTFRISGATAAEAAGGLRQFLQGLQSGALRGEELNSVLENAPRLAKLLADGLGVTIGQLRALGQEGSLSADRLIAALTERKFTDSIDAEFRELPVTFDEAMQQVENAATITFGAFDRGSGFSQMLANFVSDGSKGFGDLADEAEQAGIEIRAAFEGLGDVFAPLLAGARSVFDEIERRLSGLSQFKGIDAGSALFNSLPSTLQPLAAYVGARYTAGADRARRERQNAIAGQGIQDMFRNVDVFGNPIASSRPSGGGGAAGSSRSSQRSAEAAARKAENERLQAIRDEAAKQRELASLDDDIIAARAALATTADDMMQFELQQIDRDKEARLAKYDTDVKLGELSREEYDKRAQLVAQEADLRKQRVVLLRQEAEAQAEAVRQQNAARDEINTLGIESRIARTREERRDIEQRLLDAAYEQEEAEIRRAAANGEIADLDEALRNLRRRQLAEGELLRRDNLSPGQSYLEDLQSEADNLADSYENIAVNGLERMNRAFSDNIKSALGLHGVLGDIIGDFIELAVRQSLLKPLAEGLFGVAEAGALESAARAGMLAGSSVSSLGVAVHLVALSAPAASTA